MAMGSILNNYDIVKTVRKPLSGYLILSIIALIISLSSFAYQIGIFDLNRLNPLAIRDKIDEKRLCDSATFKILISEDVTLQNNYIVNKNGRIVSIDKKNGMYVFYTNDYKIEKKENYLILTFRDIRDCKNFFPYFDEQSFCLTNDDYEVFLKNEKIIKWENIYLGKIELEEVPEEFFSAKEIWIYSLKNGNCMISSFPMGKGDFISIDNETEPFVFEYTPEKLPELYQKKKQSCLLQKQTLSF